MNTERMYIDYVTLFFPRDVDNDSQVSAARYLRLAQDCCSDNQQPIESCKLRVASGKAGRDANYKLEIWGIAADTFARRLSLYDWGKVTRLDFRCQLPNYSDVEVKAMAAGILRKGAKGRNIAVLASQSRAKNYKRDIGGHGIRIGSGKSDDYLVIYKRGRERAAYEYRLQGRGARACVQGRLDYLAHCGYDGSYMYPQVMQAAATELRKMVAHTLQAESVEAAVAAAVDAEIEALEIVEAVRARKGIDGPQLTFWGEVARELGGEEDAFELVGFDQRGQVVKKQVNIGKLAAPCARCGKLWANHSEELHAWYEAS